MNIERTRQFVDGELSEPEAAEFELALAADETLRRQVAFERSLRDNVVQNMVASAPAAPASLRNAVEATIAAAYRQPVPVPQTDSGAIARFFAGPTRANVFAVAACLLIVVGAVIVGIFGDEWGLGLRAPAGRSSFEIRLDVMAGIAQQAGREHGRCMSNADAMAAKAHYRDAEAIQENLSGRLSVLVPVFDLSAGGLELVGGGECSLGPVPRSTVHLMYRDPTRGGGLSIFLQPNRGQFGPMENFLENARIYTPQDINACTGEPTCMLTDGRIIYIIRACDPAIQESGMAVILRAIAAPN